MFAKNENLKIGAFVVTGLLLIPVWLPAAFAYLAFLELKDKFKKCPVCSSAKLHLIGHTPGPLGSGCRTQASITRRTTLHFAYYQCQDCGARSKKAFGEGLVIVSDEELANIVPHKV